MTGEERRNALLDTIRKADNPISGAALAKKYQVSRQIIVQDIALLRKQHAEIQATPRGYMILNTSGKQMLNKEDKTEKNVSGSDEIIVQTSMKQRVFCVSHTDEQIEEELNTIVDMGGKVLDVFVKHEVYGSIRAELPLNCRRHVQEFMEGIRSGKSMPLKNLTSGLHYHTVVADSEETLDIIEKELKRKGFLK